MRNIKRTIAITTAALVMGVSVMAGAGGTVTASADGLQLIPIAGVNSPRDPSSGFPTGKRNHDPLSTTFEVDHPIFSVEEAKASIQNQPFTPH